MDYIELLRTTSARFPVRYSSDLEEITFWVPHRQFQFIKKPCKYSWIGASKLRFLDFTFVQFSSIAQLYPTLQPYGLQHTRLPCPSPATGACSNSCPSSRWCHPTISFSVIPFSSRLQSFPSSGSFPRTQFFASGGQSIGVSTSASVLPMNIQD